MVLIVHIIIALASVVQSTFGIFTSSQARLKITYYLMGATLVTGVALGFSKHINFGHACLTGIAYVTLVSVNILLAKRRSSSTES